MSVSPENASGQPEPIARWVADLARSGLIPPDINARAVSASELNACKLPPATQGYVLPYYGIDGHMKPFYRVKMFDKDIKYMQPEGSVNHVYFPPGLANTLAKPRKKVIIITEGEKKSAASVKFGFPAVGLGGVDSWRNRSLVLPDTVKFTKTESGDLRAKISANEQVSDHIQMGDLAKGLEELISWLGRHTEFTVLIVFDTDVAAGVKPEVQKSAARLAAELRFRGVGTTRIRQLILPYRDGDGKVGLDDYLTKYGADDFDNLVDATLAKRNAFPRSPTARGQIEQRLQQPNLTRKDAQETAMTILLELDARGRRLRDPAVGMLYFFDEESSRLIPVQFPDSREGAYHEGEFGRFLYQQFGLARGDTKVLTWLAAQFAGEEPIEDVQPRRVLSPVPSDPWSIAYQISDSQFAVISGDPSKAVEVYSNGARGMLFEQGHVAPISANALVQAFQEVQKLPLSNWWTDVIGTLKVKKADTALLASLLPYISPWLNQWKGMQLPVEMVLGEAGSGKSSLYNFRLSVLTGRPILRNAPSDLRDWHASISNTGGLHVTDNVQFTNKELRQRLSDEMCRIVTAPEPFIEMRKLFTTADQARIPVQTTFAITAIQRPFVAVDLLQRSVLVELDAITDAKDGNWVEHALTSHGGRAIWLAHHMYVLHLLLKLVREKWNGNYKARHRLALFEQMLFYLCEVFGIDFSLLDRLMEGTAEEVATEEDWALTGLKDYGKLMVGKYFTASDIAKWAECSEDYCDNSQLTNGFRLGRFMNAHVNLISKATGIVPTGDSSGKKRYTVNLKGK